MNGGSAEVAGSTVAVPLRQMTHSDTTKLNYQLYKENARTTVWGNDAESGKAFTAVAGDNTDYGLWYRLLRVKRLPSELLTTSS